MNWEALSSSLASALCAQITVDGLPEPCFCGVMPGAQVPLDYCGECDDRCGMAWVRLASINIEQFQQGISTNRCVSVQQATFEVGIVRCAPGPDDYGNLPDEAAQLAAVQQQMKESETITCAITTALGPTRLPYSLTTYTPSGPQGLCVGGAWLVSVSEV